jgi:ribosomal protein S18 acetylase RimI-like enzyme
MSITYRPGLPADSYAVFLVFEKTLADLLKRLGDHEPTSIADPAALAAMWEERRSLYEHLAQSADHFWVAEQANEQTNEMVGFARSILRDGVRQLTELFVLPTVQAQGVGRTLLNRVFPQENARLRTIIASPDMVAQALYLRSGVSVRLPVYYWHRQPEPVEVSTDLHFEPITATPATLAALAAIDREVLAHQRDVDHRWLLSDRQGLLYMRAGQPVGYGYVGVRNGPFALLDGADFPAVLAHAERQAAEAGRTHFGLEVPMTNHQAVAHLLARRFRIENFPAAFMSDRPFGRLAQYIITSPPFFM